MQSVFGLPFEIVCTTQGTKVEVINPLNVEVILFMTVY